MEEKYDVIFMKAGSGTGKEMEKVAQGIAVATKQPVDKILARVSSAPFVYKRDMTRDKADAIANVLRRLGAVVEIQKSGAPAKPVVAAVNPAVAKPAAGATQAAKPKAAPTPSHGAPTPSHGARSSGPSSHAAAPAVSPHKPASPIPVPSVMTESGRFDFKVEGGGIALAPPSSRSFEGLFQDNASSAASPEADLGGFKLHEEVVESKDENLAVERNIDYGVSQGETPKTAAKTARGAAIAESTDLITCPRCSVEQPRARECAHCGVIIEKAEHKEKARHAAAEDAHARPAGKSKAWIFAIPAALIVLGVLYLVGVFNPLLLKIKARFDPVLSSYGASLTRDPDRLILIHVSDTAKAAALTSSLASESDKIKQELTRLISVGTVQEYDAQRFAPDLKKKIDAYAALPAFNLRENALRIGWSLYKAENAGWDLNGTLVLSDQDAEELKRAPGMKVVEPKDIEALLTRSRADVANREEQRRRENWLATSNRDFADRFQSGNLDPRWVWNGAVPAGVQGTRGEVQWTTDGKDMIRDSKGASLPGIGEPTKDFSVEVTIRAVRGESNSRAGLVVFVDPDNFIEYMLVRRPGQTQALFGVETDGSYTAGRSRAVNEPFRFRIRKKGPQYQWETLDPLTRKWAPTDSFRPQWDAAKPKYIALAALGEPGTTYGFSDFELKLLP